MFSRRLDKEKPGEFYVFHTVDGRNPAPVVNSLSHICMVSGIPDGAGFLPSPVLIIVTIIFFSVKIVIVVVGLQFIMMPVDGCSFPKKPPGAEISDEQLVFFLMDLVGVKAKKTFDFHFL